MALTRDQTYLCAKYALITFSILTLIATFVGYGVVLQEINWYERYYPNLHNWKSWRAFAIVYLVIEDVVALVGLFGAHKENYRLVLSYGVMMTVLWFFNFFNIAIARSNVFNYLVSLGVIFCAFYFARRIRQNLFFPPVPQPYVHHMPAPAVIQVQPSYVPNPSTAFTMPYTGTTPQSTPPPPYTTQAVEPRLEFKNPAEA